MSTRRKSARLAATNGTPLTTTMPSSSIRSASSPQGRSPFIPTRLEALLLSIYPVTLALGSLFSSLSPTTRSAPYNPSSQSHPPEFAPSYFAQKKNIFNVYFVKVGWLWTTFAFVIFLVFNPGFGGGLSKRRIRAIARYVSITTWWAVVTQWFFGPPLIDRLYIFSGGNCELLRDPSATQGMSETKRFLTATACKASGGTWKGGHDISGHVFLLILGSALLWFEILPALTRAPGLRDGRRILLSDGKVASVAVEKQEGAEEGYGYTNGKSRENEETTKGVKVAIGVAALMWWMLLMTAAFFHTWFEKFTGLLTAFLGLAVVYFLPRGVPGLRAVLGMPGV